MSTKSVARAFSGHPLLSAENRLKVLETARSLGYDEHSNKGARALAARRLGRRVKHNIIAVVIGNQPLLHGAPYFSELLEGIDQAAGEHGIDLFFFRHAPGKALPRLITDAEVDGVVTVVAYEDHLRQVSTLGVPAVLVFALSDCIPCLVPDNYLGTCLATQHLIDLGHRRIAYIGLDATPGRLSAYRLAGYRDTLVKNGVSPDPRLIDASLYQIDSYVAADAIEGILSKDQSFRSGGRPSFTAVVCYNDPHGVGVAGRLQKLGLAVPGDVSVVGFDDTAHLSNLPPALTSIAFDRAAIGRRAIEMIRGGGLDNLPGMESTHEVFPVELRIRESSAPPPLVYLSR